MMPCPHCEHPVDETSTDTCPICKSKLFAVQQPSQQTPPPAEPLKPVSISSLSGAPAMPAAPASVSGVKRRVTLTGEVIEEPDAPAAPVAGQAPRPAYARPSYTNVTSTPKENTGGEKKSSHLAAILVTVCLLAVAGLGGWYYYMHRTNPKDQANKWVAAFKAQDWKTIYNLTELSAQAQQQTPNADAFASKMQQVGPPLAIFTNSMQMQAQDPTSDDGHTAVVPIKMTISLLGHTQSKNINLNMVNDNGIWKMDASNASSAGSSPGIPNMFLKR